MTTVYFVRHAQPNYENHDDMQRELTQKGMADRKLVTAFLRDKEIDLALSSPYRRSVDTIRDFTDSAGLTIEIVEDFRERRVDSVWIPDFDAFAEKQWADFSYKLTDGECLGEVQTRNVAALRRVVQTHPGKSIIVGSHGTALSTIINFFRPSFGYTDFRRIKGKMPWIVEFIFDEDGNCCAVTEHDLY